MKTKNVGVILESQVIDKGKNIEVRLPKGLIIEEGYDLEVGETSKLHIASEDVIEEWNMLHDFTEITVNCIIEIESIVKNVEKKYEKLLKQLAKKHKKRFGNIKCESH